MLEIILASLALVMAAGSAIMCLLVLKTAKNWGQAIKGALGGNARDIGLMMDEMEKGGITMFVSQLMGIDPSLVGIFAPMIQKQLKKHPILASVIPMIPQILGSESTINVQNKDINTTKPLKLTMD